MAKDTPKKTRWYKLIGQAYTQTAPHDKLLLPILLLAFLVPIALGVLVGILISGPVAIVYSFFVEYYVTGLTGSVKG